VSKWVKVDKYWYGFGGYVSFFNKIAFYAGARDSWGIGFEISFYDRAITFDILNLYFGVEIFRKEKIDGEDGKPILTRIY